MGCCSSCQRFVRVRKCKQGVVAQRGQPAFLSSKSVRAFDVRQQCVVHTSVQSNWLVQHHVVDVLLAAGEDRRLHGGQGLVVSTEDAAFYQ